MLQSSKKATLLFWTCTLMKCMFSQILGLRKVKYTINGQAKQKSDEMKMGRAVKNIRGRNGFDGVETK